MTYLVFDLILIMFQIFDALMLETLLLGKTLTTATKYQLAYFAVNCLKKKMKLKSTRSLLSETLGVWVLAMKLD